MHLDTIFNVLSRNETVMLDLSTVPGANSGKSLKRKVKIYTRAEKEGDYGKYSLEPYEPEFEEFIKNEGFKVIKVSHDD